MPATQQGKGDEYLANVIHLLEAVRVSEAGSVAAAASLLVQSISGGGWVHTFGTGHGHMLAEELFYRAGGLARVNPILIPDLMLHAGAAESSQRERQPGRAAALLAEHPIAPGDILIVASNSGGNPVIVELAEQAHAAGAKVVAITSLAHAESDLARSRGRKLHDIADVVLDNHGRPGDASLDVAGLPDAVGPTSTVVGAALLNAVVAQAAADLAGRGIPVELWRSANAAGGDAANEALIAKYRGQVPAL